jgi:hypothetical protein
VALILMAIRYGKERGVSPVVTSDLTPFVHPGTATAFGQHGAAARAEQRTIGGTGKG